MNIQPYLNKKYLVIAGVILVIIALLVAGLIFKKSQGQLSPQQKAEQALQKLIEDNLENWPTYEKTTDPNYKKFGNDSSCGRNTPGNPNFLEYEKKAQAGETHRLDLTNGAYVVYTPNYQNWDNQKLMSFGVKDLRVCSGGWLIPLHAYPDKVVWGNTQCSGLEEETDFCQQIHRIVTGFFTKKRSAQ